MFDIGFTELIVIGVVALIVIGPERLPRVARAAGHLYGRMQRYVSTVKADISNEMQLDEMRRAGEGFKESVQSITAGMEYKATAVDDYLRDEVGKVSESVTAPGTVGDERRISESPAKLPPAEQQRLPLDEPDQNAAPSQAGAVDASSSSGRTSGTPS